MLIAVLNMQGNKVKLQQSSIQMFENFVVA